MMREFREESGLKGNLFPEIMLTTTTAGNPLRLSGYWSAFKEHTNVNVQDASSRLQEASSKRCKVLDAPCKCKARARVRARARDVMCQTC